MFNDHAITRDEHFAYMDDFDALSEFAEIYLRHAGKHLEITAVLRNERVSYLVAESEVTTDTYCLLRDEPLKQGEDYQEVRFWRFNDLETLKRFQIEYLAQMMLEPSI